MSEVNMWRVVRAVDGKVLAITRGHQCINREMFETWDEFRQECASALFSALATDEDTEAAEKLLRISELEKEMEDLRRGF